MTKRVPKLFRGCCHEWGGLRAYTHEQGVLWCVSDVSCERSVAVVQISYRVAHHITNTGGSLEWLQNPV
jgi:hypothetical protein